MTRLSNWTAAFILVLAVGAFAANEETDEETAEEVAAEQAQVDIAEEKAQRIEKKTEWAEAVAWSPYR
jgi:hypothetical protein